MNTDRIRPHTRRVSRGIVVGVLGLLWALSPPVWASDTIVVGSKNFMESRLLAEMFAQLIEARTELTVTRRLGLDERPLRLRAGTERRREDNRRLVEARLRARVAAALEPPSPPRRPTRPTAASAKRHVEAKRRRSSSPSVACTACRHQSRSGRSVGLRTRLAPSRPGGGGHPGIAEQSRSWGWVW